MRNSRNPVSPGLFAAAGIVIGGLFAAASALAGPSVVDRTADEPASKALFTEHCSLCHDPATATTQRHTSEQWREIVQRMIANGAQLSDPDRDAIVDYLAKSYGPDVPATAPSDAAAPGSGAMGH